MCLESYLIERQNQKKVVPEDNFLAVRLQTIADKSPILGNFASNTGLDRLLQVSLRKGPGRQVTLDKPAFGVIFST
jgi:hypothetical protein